MQVLWCADTIVHLLYLLIGYADSEYDQQHVINICCCLQLKVYKFIITSKSWFNRYLAVNGYADFVYVCRETNAQISKTPDNFSPTRGPKPRVRTQCSQPA